MCDNVIRSLIGFMERSMGSNLSTNQTHTQLPVSHLFLCILHSCRLLFVSPMINLLCFVFYVSGFPQMCHMHVRKKNSVTGLMDY